VLPGSPPLQSLRQEFSELVWVCALRRWLAGSLHEWPLSKLLPQAMRSQSRMTDLDEELAKYRAIPEHWTYRIIRSRRNKDEESDTVIQSGILGCSAARAIAEKLQAEYDREHPNVTSWSSDLYMIELEHK
jgi:hypothetical protein